MRALRLTLSAVGWAAVSASLRAEPASGQAGDLPVEVRALLEAMPRWKFSATARTGVGYKDNVILSHTDPQASGLVRGGADFFLWRLPLLPDRGFDYFALVRAEGTRYFRRNVVDHEGEASIVTEWRYRKDDSFGVALNVNGLYFDQVLDVSDTDVQRIVVASKKTVAMLPATVRWAPRPWWWIEVQGGPKSERHRDGVYNARVEEGTLQFGWKPAERFEARVMGNHSRRRFSSREQYSAGGRPLAGTELRITEREAEVRFDFRLDAAGHWKTSSRFARLEYADNGSGYFNYRQERVRQRLQWESDTWAVRFDGTAKRRDFELMTVGVGIAPPLRVKEQFAIELQVERKLSDRWSVSASYLWERSRCNDAIASYRMNEGLLGATWSWEK